MTFGDIVKIDRITPDGEWEEYLTLRALQVNGGKASDFDAAGTDTASKRVQFRVRWNRCLPPSSCGRRATASGGAGESTASPTTTTTCTGTAPSI